MKIDWQPNPLYSKIILDDHDKQLLKAAVLLQEYQERAGWVIYYLGEGENFDLERARKAADHLDDDDNLNERVDVLYPFYLSQTDAAHCGDCTCVPCGCSKCSLEELLGTTTISGISKYNLSRINTAFNNTNDGSVSIDQAIQTLRDYLPDANAIGFERMAEVWEHQAKLSADWLTTYRDEHFPKG